MRLFRNILIFMLILSCLWIGALIIRKSFQSQPSCSLQEMAPNHPDYARCMVIKANAGDNQAMYKLALMYDVGDHIPENREQAIYWMQKAGNTNLAEAQYAIAVWAERGYFGQEGKDLIIPLYTAAAEQGHLNAMKSLANIYRDTNQEKTQYWMNKIQQVIQ